MSTKKAIAMAETLMREDRPFRATAIVNGLARKKSTGSDAFKAMKIQIEKQVWAIRYKRAWRDACIAKKTGIKRNETIEMLVMVNHIDLAEAKKVADLIY